jgi:hypothetical protein
MPTSISAQANGEFYVKASDLGLKVLAVVVAFWAAHTAYHNLLIQTQETQRKKECDRAKELRLREEEVKQREKDYKVRFYNSQVEVYFELCDVTSKIALASHPQDVRRELERFKELYVGRLTVIGDEEVYQAAQSFNNALLRMRGKDVVPGELLRLASNISRSCRSSLRGAFPSIRELPPEAPVTGEPPSTK